MSDSFDDELARRLASLESGSDSTRMPGAAAARRRAAQRTRHQIATGVVGGFAVIAIGVLGVTQPTYTTSPEPVGPAPDTSTPTAVPTTPTDSPTPTGAPTVQSPPPDPDTGPDSSDTPSAPDDDENDPTQSIPDSVFLTTDDLEAGGEDGESPYEWERTTTDTWLPCVPAMPDNAQARSFEPTAETSGDPARVDQFVEETAADQARARLDAVRRAVEECTEQNDAELSGVWSLAGVGDEAYTMAYGGPPRDEDTQTYVTATLIRSGDRVTSIFDAYTGQDYIGAPRTGLAVAAVERMCAESGDDCTGAVTQEQIYPVPDGDVTMWLTIDDVLAATGLDRINNATSPSDVPEGGPGGWAHVGLPRHPMDDGAQSLRRRMFSDTFHGVVVDEKIARFPDAESASTHYTELVAAANAFEQEGSDVTRTGTVETDEYEGTTWRMEDPEYDTVSVYGAVVRDDRVAAVTHAGDLTDEQMTDLLDRAGQALGE
ncbi:hypothetical protein CLV30_105132 [Haloactinopolyspora alba]|uniref:Uncharacterized protein n=1 Tax=Haloactinopolyspora alba TaxID=648780 RepID=A0A2P8E5B8_9ACTN|nr:hypothetical protein [Haloactinopolyspora alba]PSL04666.1 hypothetical protein CLV30_105132 [Haloactinopolyspora alba]